jgi:hypothetical protein
LLANGSQNEKKIGGNEMDHKNEKNIKLRVYGEVQVHKMEMVGFSIQVRVQGNELFGRLLGDISLINLTILKAFRFCLYLLPIFHLILFQCFLRHFHF